MSLKNKKKKQKVMNGNNEKHETISSSQKMNAQTVLPENTWYDDFLKNTSPEMNRWLQMVFRTTGAMVFTYDLQTHHFIQLFNLPEFTNEYLKADDIRLIHWEDWMHPDDIQNYQIEIQRIIDEMRKTFSIEVRLGTVKSGWKWYLNHGELIVLPNGTKFLTGMISDITEQKELQQQLLQSLMETTRLDQMKAQFLANMSHELRTPLNGILGCVKLLEMSSLDTEQKELTEGIDQSVHRMMRLVQNVLLLTELESGSLRSISESFHPAKLFESSIKDYQKAYMYANVAVTLELAENIPERLTADKENISRILNQLLDNAFKHTTNGQITLQARILEMSSEDNTAIERNGQTRSSMIQLTHNVLPAGTENDYASLQLLEIVVRDTGIGIEPEFVSVLLDSFSLSDATYTRQYQGAGLGLSICRKSAEMIHANLWVDSQLNKGSSFYLQVPVQIVLDDKSKSINMKKALVVDDDETSRILMGMFCEHAGLQPTLASSAAEALQNIEQEYYAIILMDIQMPYMSGLEAAKIISGQQKLNGTKSLLIAVTAYMMPEDTVSFFSQGFDDYLQKPINLNFFENKLRKWGIIP